MRKILEKRINLDINEDEAKVIKFLVECTSLAYHASERDMLLDSALKGLAHTVDTEKVENFLSEFTKACHKNGWCRCIEHKK